MLVGRFSVAKAEPVEIIDPTRAEFNFTDGGTLSEQRLSAVGPVLCPPIGEGG